MLNTLIILEIKNSVIYWSNDLFFLSENVEFAHNLNKLSCSFNQKWNDIP